MKSRNTMLVSPESETVEWKQSVNEWKEIVESCAAFASSQGGTIYVGVSPHGEAVGVAIGKGTMEDLANKIASNTSPRLVPSISTSARQGMTIIRIRVKEAPNKPVWAFDHPYRRSGKTNQRISQEEAMHLFMDSRHLTWDTTVLEDSTLRDVDAKAVRKFLEIANAERRWNVNPKTSAQKVLSQLGLCKGTHLKVAGLLLFGRNPQQNMTQAMVRCARFKGTIETHFIDMKVIQGNIVDQLEQAMTFIERNIRMGAEIKGLRREDQWEYPLDALREALVNAICHRDYASTANVQVRIFDDRLEIWNPGELPAGMTVGDLRREHESKPRNRLIANAFFLIKYVEQFGTGTRRIIDDCRAKGLPEPEFKVRPGTFIATFRPAKDSKSVSDASSIQAKAQEAQVKAQEAQVELTAIETALLNACLQTSKSGQELLNAAGYSTRTGNFKRVVKKMLQYGLLVMSIPGKPNSRLQKYSLTAEGKASILSGRYSGPGISARLVHD